MPAPQLPGSSTRQAERVRLERRARRLTGAVDSLHRQERGLDAAARPPELGAALSDFHRQLAQVRRRLEELRR